MILMTAFFKAIGQGVGGLLLAIICLLIGSGIGQLVWEPRALLIHSQRLLHHEKRVIAEIVENPRIVPSVQTFFNPERFAHWQIDPDILAVGQHSALKTSHKTNELKSLLEKYRQQLHVSGQVFFNLLIVAILRLWVVLLFLPLLGLLGGVGFVDGLTQRHLRKRQGARESSVLYQRAKECLKPTLFGGGVLYVGIPFSLNPQVLFLMFSLLFSLTLSLTARTYKKYL